MDDDLDRFVRAQDPVYETVLRELRGGRKETHWMWFVFPQLRGLGRSEMARFYGIASLHEAHVYLVHPVLGSRLRECATIVAASPATSATAIFGGTDAQKLRSSMTLFHRAGPDEPVFLRVLEKHYGGAPDPRTDELLA